MFSFMINIVSQSNQQWRIQGETPDTRPLNPILLVFLQFLRNIGQNITLAPYLLGLAPCPLADPGSATVPAKRLQHVNGGTATVITHLMQLESSYETVRIKVLPPAWNLSHTIHIGLGRKNGSQRGHFWITSITYMEIYDYYLPIRLPKWYVLLILSWTFGDFSLFS